MPHAVPEQTRLEIEKRPTRFDFETGDPIDSGRARLDIFVPIQLRAENGHPGAGWISHSQDAPERTRLVEAALNWSVYGHGCWHGGAVAREALTSRCEGQTTVRALRQLSV